MTAGAGSRWLLAGAVLASVPVAAAQAADDVAVVNHLAGYVLYRSGATSSRAHAFMHVRAGDMFEVPAGVQLKVVYLRGRRQETFDGPASFTVGEKASLVRKGAPPAVSVLPVGVAQKLSQTPDLVRIARLGRAGGAGPNGVTRDSAREPRLTALQQAEVLQARETYAQLRAATPADDISPELYLYAVLQDHRMFADMKVLVEEMARRQPDNGDIAVLRDYVNLRTGTR